MKVLFVTYGGGHVEMCLPVIRALREREPEWSIQLMALTTAHGVARRAGEIPLGYRDFCHGADAQRARRYGELLLPGNQHPDVSFEESIAYLGLNFLEWVEDLGEAGAFERWGEVGRQGFLPLRLFGRVFREMAPDVVVTTNSPRSEQAAVAVAAALGIPSLSMLDLFALPGDPFASRHAHADRITVLSPLVATNLVNAGIPADRIHVTGNPAFDVLTEPQAAVEGVVWRQARRWEDKLVVLWAGHREPVDAQPPHWAGSRLGQAVQDRLVQWMASREDVCLILRYHPNEWQDFAPPTPHPRIHWSQPGQESLLPVLMAADQVVVQATTVGVQAHIAGKQLVSLGFSPTVCRTGMDYARWGMGRRADSLNEMVALLGPRMEFGGAMPPLGVHAAAAVALHIVELANGAGRP